MHALLRRIWAPGSKGYSLHIPICRTDDRSLRARLPSHPVHWWRAITEPGSTCVDPYRLENGFEFIEVYTNLTILPEELLQCLVENRVHVATSVYGPVGERHDAITQMDGSFEKTIKNLQRVLKTGLPVRASIVEMEMNAGYTDSTVAFLRQ